MIYMRAVLGSKQFHRHKQQKYINLVTFSLIYKNHDIRLFLFSFSLVDNYVFNNNTVHLTLHNSKQNLHPSGDVPINFLVLKSFYIFQYTYSFLTSK